MYNNCPKCGSFNTPGTAECDCGHRFLVVDFKKQQSRSKSNLSMFTMLKKVALIALMVGSVLFFISFFGRSAWPRTSDITSEVLQPPIQDLHNLPNPFQVVENNVVYHITPRFNYQLSGLVVSNHHSDSLSDVLHERWNDFLNMKDLCVVWGDNVASGIFRELTYSSGNFTCFCKWSSRSIGQRFHFDQLSNNHLLADDDKIKRAILDVRNGDQVFLKGFLCKYENREVGFSRDTSTIRTDTGNGACETIFVTEFKVLKRANFFTRIVFQFSIILLLAGLVLFVSLAFMFPRQK